MLGLVLSNFTVKKLLCIELYYLKVLYFVVNRNVLFLLCYISLFSSYLLRAHHFVNRDKITHSATFWINMILIQENNVIMLF
jgi:hypothetical protein